MKYISIILWTLLIFWTLIHSSYAAEISSEKALELKKINDFFIRLVEKRKLEQYQLKLQREKNERIIAEYKQKQLLEDQIIFNSAENIEYKFEMDIYENMTYNRLQEKALSCEMSATSDILSHLEDKKILESSIINMISKSHYNELPKVENWKTIWWNPNVGYVGNIHEVSPGVKATQSWMTWYWVLEKPIANIYDRFNYKNKIITSQNYNESYNESDHLTEILKNLNAGNMIQLWWDYCTNPEFEDTENINSCSKFGKNRKLEWYYKEDGELKLYTGLAGEHAFYLLGYKWWVQSPTDIIVWDTKTGKHTYPVEEWMRKWNAMENKSIIIYKK